MFPELISQSQIDSNLRRTAENGYISSLKLEQLEYLALKYFGVDENGNYTSDISKVVAYTCPYSGKRLTDRSDIVLDHIIPIYSKGGTVLFNCIPASKETNKIGEKGSQHLIDWWFDKNCQYNDENAPYRLERLVNYILEAYDIVFNETTIEELEESYLIYLDDSYGEYEENDEDYANDRKEEQQLQKQAKHNHITSYLGFLNDLINQLKISNIDVTEIQDKINNLQDKGIFKDINRLELVQKCLQQAIINILGNDNRSYLTYSLNINVKKLMDSISYTNEADILNEIQNRLNNINKLCVQNNILIIDYFKNLRDIEEIDIIYKNIQDITKNDRDIFIENIEIGRDTKIQILIEMLNQAQSKEEIELILKKGSIERFKTYKKDEHGNIIKDEQRKSIIDKVYKNSIGSFWGNNPEILSIIRQKYKKLSDKLDEYYVDTVGGQRSKEGYFVRQNILIEMLNQAQSKEEIESILKAGSTEHFKTYKRDEHGNTIKDEQGKPIIDKVYEREVGNFWVSSPEILSIIRQNYKEISDKLDEYFVDTVGGQNSREGNIVRQYIFIEMLNQAQTAEEIFSILKSDSTEHFRTYKKDDQGRIIKNEQGKPIIDKVYEGEVGRFWSSNSQILSIIRQNYKEISDKLDEYFVDTHSGQISKEGNILRQNIFIEMLNQAQSKEEIESILKKDSTVHFKTYKKDDQGRTIKDEEGNPVVDKEYKSEIRNFWGNNPQLLSLLKSEYKEVYDKLDNYYVETTSGQMSNEGKKRRIEIFIEMLKQAQTAEEISSIIKSDSTEHFKTYKRDEHGNIIKDEEGNPIVDKEYKNEIGQFWSSNPQLLSLLKSEYKEVYDKLDNYYVDTYSGQMSNEGKKRRIEIFIEMLNQAQSKEEIESILKSDSTEHFRTYKKDDQGRTIKDEEGNPVVDKEYKSEIRNFWGNNPQLLSLLKSEYKEVYDKLDNYYVDTFSGQKTNEGKKRRIEIFIEMLRHAQTTEELASILKYNSKQHLRTFKKDDKGNIVIDKEYKSEIGQFWSSKSSGIIQMLFYSPEYSSDKYDTTRLSVLEYLKVSSIDEYIDKLDNSKKKNKVLIDLRDKLKEEKESLIKENEELRNIDNETTRKKAI